MIVRNLAEVQTTANHVVTNEWRSTRLLVKSDNVGYSLHHTVVPEGSEVHCHYEQHIESNYCIAGEGEVFHTESGETYPLKVGTLYTLDQHDKHIVRALKGDLHLVCVFTPAISGVETHNDRGGYDV